MPTFSLLSGSLIYEPLSAAPTKDSLDFADALARMTAACTQQELDTLTELCEVFTRQKKNVTARTKKTPSG